MNLKFILSVVFFVSAGNSYADEKPETGSRVLHQISTSPDKVIIRFQDQEIKSYDQRALDWRKFPLSDLIERNDKIYNPLLASAKIVKSSEGKNLIRSGINNGLLGSMFNAYADHIPLILRPDDVWLAITAAFAHYVNNHSDEMKSYFVYHSDRKKLEVHMVGSLQSSDESFWKTFTELMLKEMDAYTDPSLKEWLVPQFSTSTDKDKLVGQIIMMGAMQNYFAYRGVLSSALTELTLMGTLDDWKNLRKKAEKLGSYNDTLKTWSELLLPILDEFVATYSGKVNEAFWQKMVTYKRLGSGGDQLFRGWFLVFAPFDEEGNYFLNSKEQIEKTGIYATIRDNKIFHAHVSVPVSMNDNGTEHDMVFWGGLSAPSLDDKNEKIKPSVDWAIIDKVKLDDERRYDAIFSKYGYDGYSSIPEEYQKVFPEEAFKIRAINAKKDEEAQIEKWKARARAARYKLISLPAEERARAIAETYLSYPYEELEEDLRNAVSKVDYEAARSQIKEEIAKESEAERKEHEIAEEKRRAGWLKLPKAKLLKIVIGRYYEYNELHTELKAVVSESEFNDARQKMGEDENDENSGWE